MRLKALFASLFLSTSIYAIDSFTDYSIKLDEGYPRLYPHINNNSLTIDEIEQNLDQSTNYQSFLEYLKIREPKLFEHFILFHHSGSLQLASPEKPRTVLFYGGLILAFAEDQDQTTRRVEIIEFDAQAMRFNFHELRFTHGMEIERNPKKCLTCHGDDPRPIWEPYDFWPKIYGSHLSRFGTQKEKDGYTAIQAESAKDSVLSYLEFEPLRRNYNEVVETFTQYISTMAMVRMMDRWRSHDDKLSPFTYTIAAILNGCTASNDPVGQIQRLKNYLSPQQHIALEQRFEGLWQDTLATRSHFKQYLINRYDSFYPNEPIIFSMNHDRLISEVQSIAQLRFILEGVGIFLDEHTMSQGDNPFFFSVPGNSARDLLAAFFQFDADSLFAANPDFVHSQFQWPNFNCQDLARRAQSNAASGQLYQSTHNKSESSSLGTCMSCHTVNSRAPYIPFDDSSKLRDWMVRSGGLSKLQDRLSRTGSGQMPPDRNWPTDRKSSLLEVFEAISKR
ncbi:hypothetical protein [Pseudobacteriovorax antillogorgiicola]|uniref:Cytochrome c domain-containing protein n=1 Tax=Pseudobacteriovorax antillogorgiicola TaxID=1513793 RepID=A0A1Y6CGE3_9BACT|nr:hypothetical protein [Pseudobacteriovorax antillogorgiicola]TCS47572.1 hypothetical protein EDD56_12013 [Pseudobacteriovorax antillogorgiicola]SMF60452.1 hypothetical protein SAMN06296036_120127 [Pseudobacteriovorax antillogorgiicola]